jgi:hypothetical protein
MSLFSTEGVLSPFFSFYILGTIQAFVGTEGLKIGAFTLAKSEGNHLLITNRERG